MYATKIDQPGTDVKLNRITTLPPDDVTRETVAEKFAELGRELFELQELMWGADTHSVLVVLQGRDSAGKDGAIKHVVGQLNPRGVTVASFGVPDEVEREHDFLWRIHEHTPRLGEFSIFNRSHYEDVLVTRVHDLVPKQIWKDRYDEINAFEKTLAQHATIILKFFLHITFEEQERRLLERENDPRTSWKLNANDWKERAFWEPYTEAYDDAISRCANQFAPWFVVPADKKWFRNLAVAEAICKVLRPYREGWEHKLHAEGEVKKAELAAFRGVPHVPSASSKDERKKKKNRKRDRT